MPMIDGDGWADARNVLCVRLDSLGDVLLTTPAICALKRGAANRRITLLTSPSGAEAARLVPVIDEILVYESPWMKASGADHDALADRRLIDELATAKFDAGVIFTVYSQNPLPAALMCYLSGIPRRLAHCRENPYRLLTDWVSEPEPEQLIRHEVRRQLDLIASVGIECDDERLRLRVPQAARLRVSRLLDRLDIGESDAWAVIHPGSTAASRRYPPEHFAVAADGLAELGFNVLFTGAAAERELIESIQGQMRLPSHSLSGRLSLAELAALLARAPVLISNNTGPVHVAAAVGTPVVDLYALTNPQHTPWQVPHRVLNRDVPCKYCYKSVCPHGHHDCLRLVAPEDVVSATLSLLEEVGGPAARMAIPFVS